MPTRSTAADKALERKLAKLDKEFNSDFAYIREYNQTIADLKELLKNGKIDRTEYDFFDIKAREKKLAVEAKRKEAKIKQAKEEAVANDPFRYRTHKPFFMFLFEKKAK